MSIEKRTSIDDGFRILLPRDSPTQDTDGYEKYAPGTTFGVDAVRRHDQMLRHLIDGAEFQNELERHLAAKERAENKITPRDGAVAYTLGKITRRSVTMEDWQIIKNQFRQPELLEKTAHYHTAEYDKGYTENAEELASIRHSIKSLDAVESATLNMFMNDNAAPFLHQSRDVTATDDVFDWQGWLGQQADDDQLLNVLQWHAYVSGEQLANPRIKDKIADKKIVFKTVLPQLVDQGILATQANEAITSIDTIDVHISDVFDTVIKGRAGYYRSGAKHIVIQQGIGATAGERYASLVNAIDGVTFHEFTHAILANNYGVGNEAMDARWLNEALTERIGQAFKMYDGSRDFWDMAAYLDEDRLLTRVLRGKDDNAVDMKIATRAYSGGEQELNELTSALDASWGVENALGKVSQAIASCEATFKPDDTLQQRNRQIKAVRFVDTMLDVNPDFVFDR